MVKSHRAKISNTVLAAWLGVVFVILSTSAVAATLPLSPGGHLTQANSAPVNGPVDIEVNFYDAATGGKKLGAAYEFPGTTLSQGVFILAIEIAPSALTWARPATTTAIQGQVKPSSNYLNIKALSGSAQVFHQA